MYICVLLILHREKLLSFTNNNNNNNNKVNINLFVVESHLVSCIIKKIIWIDRSNVRVDFC